LAVSANHHLDANNDKGEAWVWKTVLQLWTFTNEMWEHRNSVLHNTQLESSRVMWEADINDAITKLYEKVDTYSAEDWWYFDVPMGTQLCKLLSLRQQWLVNARILVNKLEQWALIGQMTMNLYYSHLPSVRTVTNASLVEWIGSAWQYIQMNLLTLWHSCTMGPGWKITSHSLWCSISLLYLCCHRRSSYYTWKGCSAMPLECFCLW
jgi:hypothetical protein